MFDKAKIETDVNEYLTIFEGLFEKIMKARGDTYKWEDVVKDREQLRGVARFMRQRHKFQRGKVGPIEEVSLFCSKIDELRPFRLENYSDEKDINACLNSMYFYSAVAEMRRQEEKNNLVSKGMWKRGMKIKIWPKSRQVFDELYQNFLFGELSEIRLEKLAENLLYNLTPHKPDYVKKLRSSFLPPLFPI